MKSPRRHFSPSVYRAILVRQNWKCACGCNLLLSTAGIYHFDHILPLSLGGLDEESNLQALILGHHKAKSHKEASARAKTKRIIAQDGLRRKKVSERDKVMAKVLAEG